MLIPLKSMSSTRRQDVIPSFEMKATSQRNNITFLSFKKKKKETINKISNTRPIFILRTMLHLVVHTASLMLLLVINICQGKEIRDNGGLIGGLKMWECSCVFNRMPIQLTVSAQYFIH